MKLEASLESLHRTTAHEATATIKTHSTQPSLGNQPWTAQHLTPDRIDRGPLHTDTAAARFEKRYGALLAKLKSAYADPDQWKPLLSDPEVSTAYRSLLSELQYHAHGALNPRGSASHLAIIERIAALTGITDVEISELARTHPVLISAGAWRPMTVRIGTMAETANSEPSTDKYLTLLNALSKRIIPPVFETPFKPLMEGAREVLDLARAGRTGDARRIAARELMLAPLKLMYESADVATRWLEAGGQPTAHFIETIAHKLDKMGDARRDSLQRKFKVMRQALDDIHASPKQIAKMSTEEQKMVLLTAGTLRQTADDVDTWMDFLRDPEDRKNPELVNRMHLDRTTPLDVAATLMHYAAGGLAKLTDKDAWDLFSVRLEGGAGAQAGGQGFKGSLGLIFPSSVEYRNGSATIKGEWALSMILFIKRDEITSRGGKSSVTLGPLGVRDSDFAQAFNFKNELLLPIGAAFQTDVALPPAVEVSMYASLPLPAGSPVGAKVGVDVAVLHPHLSSIEPWVKPLAATLGVGTEILTDVVVSAWSSGKRILSWFNDAKPETTAPDELTTSRLGRSASAIRRARLKLATIQAYRRIIEKRLDQGLPLAQTDSAAFEQMVKGVGLEGATEIITEFLTKTEQALSSDLEHLDTATSSAEGTPWEEFSLHNSIRRHTKKLHVDGQSFKMANVLLAKLFAEELPLELDRAVAVAPFSRD